VLTRYDDIVEVEGNADLFLSKDTLRPLVPIYPVTGQVRMTAARNRSGC
jgi:hypothetical protein